MGSFQHLPIVVLQVVQVGVFVLTCSSKHSFLRRKHEPMEPLPHYCTALECAAGYNIVSIDALKLESRHGLSVTERWYV